MHYLVVRPVVKSDCVFLRVAAPIRPFAKNTTAVSNIVKCAIHRAGVHAPAHGAHVLRHYFLRSAMIQRVVKPFKIRQTDVIDSI